MAAEPTKFWNPYVAGVALGLVLTATYLFVGHGLGASGPALRAGALAVAAVAPAHAAAVPPLAKVVAEPHPLSNYYVYLGIGALLGGFVAAFTSGRLRPGITKGPTSSDRRRLAAAVGGGALLGIGAGLARGCASGQALTGGGLLSAGSWLFMACIFVGGYGAIGFARRQWR
jgi:uncharacterized membrane protein YedE/YeeE